MTAAADLAADIVVGTKGHSRSKLHVLRGGREAAAAPSSSGGYAFSADAEQLETAYMRLRRAELHAPTHAVRSAINSARGLLDLGDNWDGEGSPGYAEATLERARHFLENGATRLWEEHQVMPRIPHVGAGPDGSIDIHWRDTERHLLVNVPADPAEVISFYGHDPSSEVKGEFDANADTDWLLRWLAR